MLDFCRWYEQYFIRKVADVALTVSEEMKKDIMKNWGVKKVDWSADPGCRLL